MTIPAPTFAHLRRLTDAGGLFEHAEGNVPRREHGYCVDDVARGLVVVCRESSLGGEGADLRALYVEFLLAAQVADGRFRNRRNVDLRWTTQPGVGDWWGRAVWGLGAATTTPAGDIDERLLAAFDRSAVWRPSWVRAMSVAALGADEVLRTLPDHEPALHLLAAAADIIGRPRPTARWPWPEERLRYANATLAHALIAAGDRLHDQRMLGDGTFLLDWLLTLQTYRSHLSLVPVAGRGPFDAAVTFDQQPIEAGTLADACARAFEATGDPRWCDGIELAAHWFLGRNDANTALYDAQTGGCCDGLQRAGRNANQGAESTIALISTLQHTRSLVRSP